MKIPEQYYAEPNNAAHEARALDSKRQAQHASSKCNVDDVEDRVERTAITAGGRDGRTRRCGAD